MQKNKKKTKESKAKVTISKKGKPAKKADKAAKGLKSSGKKKEIAKSELPLEKRLSSDKTVQNEIKKLLNAPTPEKYIDLSIKSKLSGSIKGLITRHWLEQNGFGIDDIKYARNRHPYWKEKKQTNHTERTKKRFEEYNFSDGIPRKWTKDELDEFIKINDQYSDRELAEHFTRSIPSIQGIRRRINLGLRILEAKGEKSIKKSSLSKFVKIDEKVLRRELSEIKRD